MGAEREIKRNSQRRNLEKIEIFRQKERGKERT